MYMKNTKQWDIFHARELETKRINVISYDEKVSKMYFKVTKSEFNPWKTIIPLLPTQVVTTRITKNVYSKLWKFDLINTYLIKLFIKLLHSVVDIIKPKLFNIQL